MRLIIIQSLQLCMIDFTSARNFIQRPERLLKFLKYNFDCRHRLAIKMQTEAKKLKPTQNERVDTPLMIRASENCKYIKSFCGEIKLPIPRHHPQEKYIASMTSQKTEQEDVGKKY